MMIVAVRITGEGPSPPPKSHPAVVDAPDDSIGPDYSEAAMILCNKLEVDAVLCGTEGNSSLNG